MSLLLPSNQHSLWPAFSTHDPTDRGTFSFLNGDDDTNAPMHVLSLEA